MKILFAVLFFVSISLVLFLKSPEPFQTQNFNPASNLSLHGVQKSDSSPIQSLIAKVTQNETPEDLRSKYHAVIGYHLKPFSTVSEREAAQQLMADSKVIQNSFKLLQSDAGYFEKTERGFKADRLDAIEYLAHALEWSQNPQTEFIVGHIKTALLESKPPVDDDLQKKKSWIGDQIELYSILLQTHPAEAKQLAAQADGTPLAKILELSQQRTQQLKKAAL